MSASPYNGGMGGLTIAADLTLPVDLATDTSAILARKGAGKTYTGAVLFEEDVANGIPAVALDPLGAFWGLRASADGKSEGLPVTILGGEHGDAPLERTSGKLVADLVVDQPSWYVLDLSGFDTDAAQDQFAADFAARLYRAKAKEATRTPLHLIIDEADSFAPQQAKGRERMLGAYEAIARRGRIRGIGSTFITQRPAVLNKNVLTQSEVLITLQITSPQDRKAVKEWAEGHADKAQVDEYLAGLASLKRGQAWVWSPTLDLFKQVQIRQRRTFDSSATPKPGETRAEPARLAAVDVERLREQMAESFEKAEAQDPKKLQAQVAALRRDLAAAQRDQPPAAVRVETVEVPVVPSEAVLALARVHEGLVSFCDALDTMASEVRPIAQELTRTLKEVEAHIDAPPTRGVAPPSAHPAPAERRAPAPVDGDVVLDKAQRKVLTVLAQHDGRTRQQLAMLAGYTWSGGFRNTLSALRTAGLIAGGNQETMHITDAGREALGDAVEPLPEGSALLDWWMGKLDSGQRKILRHLVDVYPAEVPGPALAEACGYEWSGGFRNYLSSLRTLELIVGKNMDGVRASDDLVQAVAA